MITIVPVGGLGNRMRSLASARILARRAEQPLQVHWYRMPDFNSRFAAIFCTDALPFRVAERWANVGFAGSALQKYESLLPRCGKTVVIPAGATREGFDLEAAISAARRGNVYIRSFSKFLDEPEILGVFRPVAAIQQVLGELAPNLSGAIAVHIRRTDNGPAIRESPMSAFISRMDQEIARDSGARFFVATDEPKAYAELARRYGERVFEYAKPTVARDDPAGIRHAVIDLYALSRCKKIIGSYWSSFTDIAAELGGIDRIVATK